MKIDINKLLKKKKLTGTEIAKISITNSARQYQQVLTGKKVDDIIPESTIRNLINGIDDQYEWENYKKLAAIERWIGSNYRVASAHEQQAQLYIDKFAYNLQMIGASERIKDFFNHLPFLMTDKEFKAKLKEKKEKLLNDETPLKMIDILEESICSLVEDFEENKKRNSLGGRIYKITSNIPASERVTKIYKGFFKKEETPEKVSKWDILTTGDLFEVYKCFDYINEGEEATEWHIREFEEFIEDYPKTFNLIKNEIKKYFPEVENLPLKDWFKFEYQYKQLYEIDFLGLLSNRLKNKYIVFDDNYNAIMGGVATMQFEDKKPNFDYKNFIKTLCITNLDELILENDDTYTELEVYRGYREEIKRSLYFLKGYNIALDLIIKYYDIEIIEIYKSRLWWFNKRLEALNKIIDIKLDYLKGTHHKNQEEKKKKIEVFNEIFEKIDVESLIIPEHQLQEATQLIKTGRGFNNTSHLIDLMAEYSLLKVE